MTTHLFLVDVEATGPAPFSSVMTEFGVVEFESRKTFHGRIWESSPTEANPALSETVGDEPLLTVSYNGAEPVMFDQRKAVYRVLTEWLEDFGPGNKVFVSDNPAFDFMWIAYGFDSVGLNNPFGHSARRIGDLYAGLSGNWRNTQKWKRFRQTKHDHNPVNDAMGNAEALEKILRIYQDWNP